MSFEAQQDQQDNLETYRQIKRQASNLNSQLASWKGQFDALRAGVDAEKQGELDTRFNEFVSQLRTTLGI